MLSIYATHEVHIWLHRVKESADVGMHIPLERIKPYEVCAGVLLQVYSQLEGQESQVVNTAWAILALIAAGYHHRETKQIQAGIRNLLHKQLASGDWPQEHISGVFNRNCMITYANYRSVHPCSS